MLHTGIIYEFIVVLSARECFYNIAHIFNFINTLHAIIHQQHLVFYPNVIKMLSQATWDIALSVGWERSRKLRSWAPHIIARTASYLVLL